ncbi:MAG: atrA protein [Mycobacterium sp.]|nr:atrA protein [Mycobacterium sp.]
MSSVRPSDPTRAGRPGLRRRTAAVALPVLLAAAAGLTACGSSSSSSTSTTSSGSAASGSAASLLPAAVKKSGELRAATDGTYPPNEYRDSAGGPLQGFDIDLANAIAQKLGVKITFDDAKFDSLITGIAGGRYDLALSSMTDNKEREQKVDFVDYFTAGTSILVKKGNPQHIATLEDLCGQDVALEAGTVQVKIAQGAKCAARNPIKVAQLPDDATARQQVLTGRAVADMNDFPVAEYTARTSGGGNDFEVVGQQYDSAPYGVAVAKDIKGLTAAVQAALKEVIADGTYDQLMTKYGIEAGALKTATVNGATS